MTRLPALTLLALIAWTAPAGAAGASPGWRWPVPGPVLERFRAGPDPFAPGQHRGIDIGAHAGDPVRAPCAGPVRFAGTVGRAGRTVSLACGRYVVSHQGLVAIEVRSGTRVASGDVIGTAGGRGVHVGVRIAARPFGYVDPLSLLRRPGARAPVPGPLPLGRAPRLGRSPRSATPLPPAPPVVVVPRAAPAGAPVVPRVPVLAWAGFGLVTLAAPAAAIRRSRRRARGRREDAAATNRLAALVRALR